MVHISENDFCRDASRDDRNECLMAFCAIVIFLLFTFLHLGLVCNRFGFNTGTLSNKKTIQEKENLNYFAIVSFENGQVITAQSTKIITTTTTTGMTTATTISATTPDACLIEENMTIPGHDINDGPQDPRQNDAEGCRSFCKANYPSTMYFTWIGLSYLVLCLVSCRSVNTTISELSPKFPNFIEKSVKINRNSDKYTYNNV